MNLLTLQKGLLPVAIVVFLISCSVDEKTPAKKENAVPVTLIAPSTGNGDVVQASGQIESTETAVISTRVMGYVTSIKVAIGDHVKKGQLLATISNSDILAKRAQAQAMVAEAEAALTDAKKDLERYTALFEEQSASAKELENVTLHYNSVKSKAIAAREMQREAESMLQYTNITAPFNGVVTNKSLDEGSMANPGMPILVLEQANSYHVVTSVTEKDIAAIAPGSEATITIKSNGRIIKGTVSEVSPSSKMSGGQFIVKVKIPTAEYTGLYAGMFTNVAIKSSTERQSGQNSVLVPASAIIKKDQLTGLYTVSENKTALFRYVTLGKNYGDQVEILSGLTNSEKYILTAKGKLYNGVPVSIQQ